MRILWSKNNLPLSWLIRWGTGEASSHLAIELDDRIIFHSNLAGVHIRFSENFKKENTIVHDLSLDLTADEEEEVYYKAISQKEGKFYDFCGFLYIAYRILIFRFFGDPLPERNPFQKDSAFMCHELITCLPDRIVNRLNIVDISMTTPERVHRAFMSSRAAKFLDGK